MPTKFTGLLFCPLSTSLARPSHLPFDPLSTRPYFCALTNPMTPIFGASINPMPNPLPVTPHVDDDGCTAAPTSAAAATKEDHNDNDGCGANVNGDDGGGGANVHDDVDDGCGADFYVHGGNNEGRRRLGRARGRRRMERARRRGGQEEGGE